MTISELIAALEAIRAEHGDVDVYANPPTDKYMVEPLFVGDVYMDVTDTHLVISP